MPGTALFDITLGVPRVAANEGVFNSINLAEALDSADEALDEALGEAWPAAFRDLIFN